MGLEVKEDEEEKKSSTSITMGEVPVDNLT